MEKLRFEKVTDTVEEIKKLSTTHNLTFFEVLRVSETFLREKILEADVFKRDRSSYVYAIIMVVGAILAVVGALTNKSHTSEFLLGQIWSASWFIMVAKFF